MSINQRMAAVVDTDTLSTYVQRVYAWMVGGLGLTAITALFMYSNPELLVTIFSTPLRWVVLLAPFAMVLFLSTRIEHIKPSTAAGTFIVYSIVNGIAFSSIFMIYNLGSIANVFIIAAAMYGASAVYGYVTKRDLTSMGSFMFMGLIGIICASFLNWFIGFQPLSMAISVLGVLIFTGLTAYDMQRIKTDALAMYHGQAIAHKSAIMGALNLYLNFVNMFLFLLRLLGSRK